MRRCRALAALIAIAALAGCAQQQRIDSVPWQTHSEQMQALRGWHLLGKLGYRHGADGGSAWIDWRQQGESFDVRLHGPFGAGATYIRGDAQGAVLSQSGSPEQTAATPAALTTELFGWTLPVEQLRYWVRGVPDPGLPVAAFEVDARGVLIRLRQHDWLLQFLDYGATPVGRLPGRILAVYDAPDAPPLRVTLVIKSWQVAGDEG